MPSPWVPERSGVAARGEPAAPARALPEALGPLAPHVGPGTTDLLVDGDGRIWIDAGGGLRRVDGPPLGPAEARRLAVGLIAAGGRHLDDAKPIK